MCYSEGVQEALMTRVFLFILVSSVIAFPSLAFAQLGGSPSGDFRVQDRPGTAPTAGPPGGPSLPAAPTLFPNLTGKSPDEFLKRLDKDLGKSTVSPFGGRSFELPPDLGAGGSLGPRSDDLLKR
jgi:hypothetical protein